MTAVYDARTIRARATKAEMEARYDTLAEIVAENHPCSSRNVYYIATTLGIVPKTDSGYRKVQRALVELRRSGRLPYGRLVDSTRWMRKPDTHRDLASAVAGWASYYRRDLWRAAPEQVEVWCESESIAGVIADVTELWDVPLFPCRGFSSLEFVFSAAEGANSDGRPLVIYYVGDHDPHGLDIERALQQELRGHLDVPLNFSRVGVTWDQVEQYDLPGTKPKTTRNYEFPMAVEAEALPAPILRDLLHRAIEDHVDHDRLRVLQVAEAEERTILLDFAERLVS